MIARVREQRAKDAAATDAQDDVVFVTITDGHENCSKEISLTDVRERIAACEAEGWTFVYLSAGIDAFGDAQRLGVNPGRRRAFRASKAGTDEMFDSLNLNMMNFRDKKRRGLDTSSDDFFDDDKVNRILGDDE